MTNEPNYRLMVQELWGTAYISEPGARGRCLYMDPAIEELTGYPAQRWENDPLHWVDCIHGDDLDRVLGDCTEAHPRVIEYRFVRSDGETVWVSDASIPMMRDDGSWVRHGVLWDITEKKARQEATQAALFHELQAQMSAQEELAKSRNLLERVLNQLPAVVWTTDLELNLLTIKGSGVELLGLEITETITYTIPKLARATTDPETVMRAHLSALRGEIATYELEGFGGRHQACEVAPLRTGGEIVGVIGISLDVTESHLRAEREAGA